MNNALIYIHGKGGNPHDAVQYQRLCPEYDVIGAVYCPDTPWQAEKDINAFYNSIKNQYTRVDILAESIGAYFAMLALQHEAIHEAFFISPILDMELLITNMTQWAGFSLDDLEEKGKIQTEFGETLSWDYLSFVRNHPIIWNTPTRILFAENDYMTSQSTLTQFLDTHNADAVTMSHGEHWFHTKEQIAFRNRWLEQVFQTPYSLSIHRSNCKNG